MTSEAVKQATFIVCPLCDKRECVGRHDCKEIAEYVKRKEQGVATEKRLIDVDAFRDYWNKNYRHQYANDTFLFALANFPTVDAVEVVHGRWITDIENDEVCG